jgi:hypothetical protein
MWNLWGMQQRMLGFQTTEPQAMTYVFFIFVPYIQPGSWLAMETPPIETITHR